MNRWPTLKIANVLNTDIVLDWTLLLMLLDYMPSLGVLLGLKLLAVVLISVLLHELGHVFVAQKFKRFTSNINLNFFGGAASIDLTGIKPKEEILIALAGPAVSLSLAIISTIPFFAGALVFEPYSFLGLAVTMNAVLALFNLIPIFPMDGGRVLRGLLATKLSFYRATQIASITGVALSAAALVASAVFGMPQFVFVFIFILALGEYLVNRKGHF